MSSTTTSRPSRIERRLRRESSPDDQTPSLDFRSHITALLRFWLSTILVIALGIFVAASVTFFITPKYQSTITFFVATSSSGSATTSNTPLQADEFAQRRINSYLGVVTSEQFAQRIIDDTGVALTPTVLSQMITATAEPQTVLMNVAVTDESKDRSLIIAKSIASNLDTTIGRLDNRGNSNSVELRAISGPSLNPVPVSPRKKLNVAIGLLIGLAAGVAQALIRHQLDSSFRERDRLTATTNLPMLGELNFDRAAVKAPILLPGMQSTRRAESFRQMRTNLRFIDAANLLSVIVLTSSVKDEGKTTAAANLANSFADAGRRTLLVDADLRQPRLQQYLGLSGRTGLTNLLIGDAMLDEVVQDWGEHGLQVLASGPTPPNPSELLGSSAMDGLMQRLRHDYEIVIIDTPPLLPVTDAAVLAAVADGVMLVVRNGRTRRDQVAKSLDTLAAVGARVLGSVFTMVPQSRRERNATSYYHPTVWPSAGRHND